MSNEITIQVNTRDAGKAAARGLRGKEITPAIIYSKKIGNILMSIEQKLVDKYQKVLKENPIFVLESSDKQLNGLKALMKDITYHPVNRKPVHVDFVAIAADQAIAVEVEVILKGTPRGVKSDGGNLSVITHKVEIECLPSNIPSKIEFDISELGLDESVHVADLKAPQGVTILTSSDVTICTIHVVDEDQGASKLTPEEQAAVLADPAAATAAAAPAAPAKK